MSVFLLPEQMRSLKMKHKNFKLCDSDTVVYDVMYGRWR